MIGVFSVALVAAFLVSRDRAAPKRSPSPLPGDMVGMGVAPHVAGSSALLLSSVELSVLYFMPRDRTNLAWDGWREHAEKALKEMRAFHHLQFRGASQLSYTIQPEPIIGDHDGAFYDSGDTARGNLHAWETIREELARKLGDLPQKTSSFQVHLVLYEGVGALGGDHQILVSSGYLRSPVERVHASSVFYHELGHTFGLEDAYEYEHGTPLDEDIMGLGRNKPIGQVYLSEKAKEKLGIMH